MNDWVCDNCKSINRGSATVCYSCGGPREIVAAGGPFAVGTTPAVAAMAATDGGGGAAAISLPTTADGGPLGTGLIGVAAPEAAPAQPAETTNIVAGFLAGIVAAVLASALWYTVVVVSGYQVGIVAIAVGFVVGQGVVLGASRRGSVVLAAVSVVLTLLALVVSEYLVVAHFVGKELAAEGLALEVLQPIGFVLEVVVESIRSDPLTLVFWAIALFQAFAIPARLLGPRQG